MNKFNNPSYRLHSILEDIELEAKRSPSSKAFEVWARALKLDPPDFITLAPQIVPLQDLISLVEKYVKSLKDIEHDRYLQYIPALKDLLSPNSLVNYSGSNITGIVSKHVLDTIAFCGDAIENCSLELEIDEKEIEEFSNQIEELAKELEESSLSEPTKIFINQQLETIKGALISHKIRGAYAFKEALTKNYGEFLFNKELIQNNKTSEEKEYLQRLWKLTQKMDWWVSFALKVQRLEEKVSPLLGKLFE